MSGVALLGAAGAVGRSLGDALRQEGTPFRAIGRSATSLEAAFGTDPRVERVTWNPDDPSSVRAALRGVETLFYLVGVPYTDFRLHPVVMRQTLEGAIAEGVRNVVLIGTVYPFGVPRTTPVREDHPREPHTFKGRMRKEQEDLLMEADAAGKVRGTVLRLPDFYGPDVESSYLHSAFVAAARGGRANLIGPVDVPHEFVYVPDVGPAALALSRKEEAWGRTWHLGGAGTATQADLVALLFMVAGKSPRTFVAGPAMVKALGLFNPFLREVAEMQYLFRTPVVLDDSALRALLPGLRKTPYEEGIRRSLAAARVR